MLRIGIAGCGRAARIHADRLARVPEAAIVGCADSDRPSAEALARVLEQAEGTAARPITVATDHRELLQAGLDALCIFTPHRWHYRLAMDALQAGCHVFIEKPLSTNLQEAVDIVGVARGRSLKVAVGHQYRLCPSLVEARRLLQAGAIGALAMVMATFARPWPDAQTAGQKDWRTDPGLSGGGVLTDAGDHLLDALLWTTGQAADEAYAIQKTHECGLDRITTAAVRLVDGTPVALGISGAASEPFFELTFFGERGRLRASEQSLELHELSAPLRQIDLPRQSESIDANFVSALNDDKAPCCPGEEALETVRLLEALVRSAATGHRVRLAPR